MTTPTNNADRSERGEGDATLLKATGIKADGTPLSMEDFLASQDKEGEDLASDGEIAGMATGTEYYDAIQRAFPPGNSNGDDYA